MYDQTGGVARTHCRPRTPRTSNLADAQIKDWRRIGMLASEGLTSPDRIQTAMTPCDLHRPRPKCTGGTMYEHCEFKRERKRDPRSSALRCIGWRVRAPQAGMLPMETRSGSQNGLGTWVRQQRGRGDRQTFGRCWTRPNNLRPKLGRNRRTLAKFGPFGGGVRPMSARGRPNLARGRPKFGENSRELGKK